jgi:5-methylcytosine-specific restriction endonuclease McrA
MKNKKDISSCQQARYKKLYSSTWRNQLKKQIKERDNYQCQNSNCRRNSVRLHVHHIDYDEENCSFDNLITLCTSCHIKTNRNRYYWKEFYSDLLKDSNKETS